MPPPHHYLTEQLQWRSLSPEASGVRRGPTDVRVSTGIRGPTDVRGSTGVRGSTDVRGSTGREGSTEALQRATASPRVLRRRYVSHSSLQVLV